jgi:hypothetical protein
MSDFFPVVVPTILIGETYLVFEDWAVRAVPRGMSYDQGLTVANLSESGRFTIATQSGPSDSILKASMKMFRTAFEQLTVEQLTALKLLKPEIEGAIAVVTTMQKSAKDLKAARAKDAMERKRQAIALTPEEAAERDRKRKQSSDRRAEAARAEAEEIRLKILGVKPQDKDQATLEILSAMASISSPATLTKRFNYDQLIMVCEAKGLSVDGSARDLADRIADLKANQNGSFATV